MVVPHPSWTEGGGPGMAGCILLSHEGFVDHAREMKEATFVDLAFTRTAIFFSRKETQVKHSQVLTEPPRQFPPPSVKWLKPSPAEQLPAFSQHPPPTDTPAPSSPRPAGIGHNPSAGRRSLQNGQVYGSGPGYNLEVSENESQSQKTLSFDLFFLWCVTSHVLFTVLLKRDSNINLHIFESDEDSELIGEWMRLLGWLLKTITSVKLTLTSVQFQMHSVDIYLTAIWASFLFFGEGSQRKHKHIE